MLREYADEQEKIEEEFKASVLAIDPKRYFEWFEKPRDPLEGVEIRQITPDDPVEMAQALADMKRMGLIDS